MQLFLLVISFILGIIAANIAVKKGKNPYLWFSIGLLFGLLGVFILYFFNKPPPVQAPTQPLKVAPTSLTLWYYLNKEHQQCGPITFMALKNELQAGELPPSTYVWSEELDNWQQIKDLPYFEPP